MSARLCSFVCERFRAGNQRDSSLRGFHSIMQFGEIGCVSSTVLIHRPASNFAVAGHIVAPSGRDLAGVVHRGAYGCPPWMHSSSGSYRNLPF